MNAAEAEIPTLVKRWILGQEPNMIQVILDLDLYLYARRGPHGWAPLHWTTRSCAASGHVGYLN